MAGYGLLDTSIPLLERRGTYSNSLLEQKGRQQGTSVQPEFTAVTSWPYATESLWVLNRKMPSYKGFFMADPVLSLDTNLRRGAAD